MSLPDLAFHRTPLRTKMPNKPIDLHMHSTASDGIFSPTVLVERAKSQGLEVIALTDHDTCSGFNEAQVAGIEMGIEVLPGIELSAYDQREVHVLGYFIDPKHDDVISLTQSRQSARRARVIRICEILATYDVPLNPETVFEYAGVNVGRPHIAAALKKSGFVKSYDEAFRRFLARGAVAYVPASTLSVEDAISFLHGVGGVAVIAHPGVDGLMDRLEEWSTLGLDGVEVFHPAHSNRQICELKQEASRLGLATTGGSDFHGPKGACELGGLGIDRDQLNTLRSKGAEHSARRLGQELLQ